RYIALNPVRAGLAKSAADWRWSSYRYTAGLASPPSWLDTARMLAYFGEENDKQRLSAFRVFVANGINEENPLKGRRKSQKAEAAPKSLADYAAQSDRTRALAEAISSGAYSKKDIAQAFGINRKTVSRADQ